MAVIATLSLLKLLKIGPEVSDLSLIRIRINEKQQHNVHDSSLD